MKKIIMALVLMPFVSWSATLHVGDEKFTPSDKTGYTYEFSSCAASASYSESKGFVLTFWGDSEVLGNISWSGGAGLNVKVSFGKLVVLLGAITSSGGGLLEINGPGTLRIINGKINPYSADVKLFGAVVEVTSRAGELAILTSGSVAVELSCLSIAGYGTVMRARGGFKFIASMISILGQDCSSGDGIANRAAIEDSNYIGSRFGGMSIEGCVLTVVEEHHSEKAGLYITGRLSVYDSVVTIASEGECFRAKGGSSFGNVLMLGVSRGSCSVYGNSSDDETRKAFFADGKYVFGAATAMPAIDAGYVEIDGGKLEVCAPDGGAVASYDFTMKDGALKMVDSVDYSMVIKEMLAEGAVMGVISACSTPMEWTTLHTQILADMIMKLTAVVDGAPEGRAESVVKTQRFCQTGGSIDQGTALYGCAMTLTRATFLGTWYTPAFCGGSLKSDVHRYDSGVFDEKGYYDTAPTNALGQVLTRVEYEPYWVYLNGGDTPTQCNVVFNANGGQCSTTSRQIVKDAEIGTLPTATWSGYTFDGWYTSASGGTKVTATTKVTGNVTLYAHWTKNVTYCTVRFNANGGFCSTTSKTYASGSTIGTLPTATWGGYTFDGWYTSASGGTKVTASTVVTAAVTCYAHWRLQDYNVVYVLNGGANAKANPATYTIEDAVTLAAPTRSGYTFTGWTPDGGKISKGSTGDRTFTANWEEIVVPPPVEPVDPVEPVEPPVEPVDPVDPVEPPVDPVDPVDPPVDPADPVDPVGPSFDPPTLVNEKGTVIDVEKGEVAPYAVGVAVYDGYVVQDGAVKGTIQVKVAKGKTNKKTGAFEAKVTATVQLVGEKKKLSFKGGVADEAGSASVMSASGHELVVSLGVNGLGGEFRRAGGSALYRVDGARNIFSDKTSKPRVTEIESKWVGAINVVGDDVALAVSVAKKGKVKVSGTVGGAKVTATTQLLVGETVCCVPVVITKKANLAFNLWLTADGTVKIVGLENAVVGKAGALKPGAKFVFGEAAVKGFAALPGVLTEYLPAGLAVMQNKAKWVVAPDEKGKAAKMGKVVFDKKTGEIDKDKLGANPSGLKLTYTAKTGSFKGSFKAYCVAKGKLKSYTVNVTGVLVDGVGYGTATIKNFGSLPVVIDDVFAGSDDDSPPGGGSETDISPSQDTWLASALAYGYIDDSSEDTGNPNWPIERGLWAVTKDANGNCVLEVNSSFGKATFRSAELDDLCADVSRQYSEVLLTGSGGETLILSRRFDLAWYFTDYDGSVTGGIFGNREFGVHGASDRFGAQQAAVVKAGVKKYVDVVAGTYRLRVSELSESSRQTQYGYYPYEYYFDDAGDLSSSELKLTVARDGMASVSGTIDRASVSGTTRLLFWTAADYANAIFWIPLADGCEAVLFISFYSTGSTRVSGNGMILFD